MNIITDITNKFNINILDADSLDKWNKAQPIQHLFCDKCPHRSTCSNPKCVFNGHYKHKIFRSPSFQGESHYSIIWIQRVLCTGCRKTFSLFPFFHLPYHSFLLEDAIDILTYHFLSIYSNPILEIDKPDFLRAQQKLINQAGSHFNEVFNQKQLDYLMTLPSVAAHLVQIITQINTGSSRKSSNFP